MNDSISGSAFFDWYAATVTTEPSQLREVLELTLSAVAVDARGLHGYPYGFDFLRNGDVIAKMIFGRGEQPPHVWASGVDAQPLADVLRAHYPPRPPGHDPADPPATHWVTRVDVAYDFMEGEPWQPLYDALVAEADTLPGGEPRRRPLKVTTVGDWIREAEGFPGGRTFYLGSMKSPVFARLYEKGKQMRALYPDQLDKYPLGWVRLELQVRPAGDARLELASRLPAEFWGVGQWARSLHSRVFASGLSPVKMAGHRPGDDERAFRFMLAQYGKMIRRRIDNGHHVDGPARLAAYEAFGRELGSLLG